MLVLLVEFFMKLGEGEGLLVELLLGLGDGVRCRALFYLDAFYGGKRDGWETARGRGGKVFITWGWVFDCFRIYNR